jgi:hypothetical protein
VEGPSGSALLLLIVVQHIRNYPGYSRVRIYPHPPVLMISLPPFHCLGPLATVPVTFGEATTCGGPHITLLSGASHG